MAVNEEFKKKIRQGKRRQKELGKPRAVFVELLAKSRCAAYSAGGVEYPACEGPILGFGHNDVTYLTLPVASTHPLIDLLHTRSRRGKVQRGWRSGVRTRKGYVGLSWEFVKENTYVVAELRQYIPEYVEVLEKFSRHLWRTFRKKFTHETPAASDDAPVKPIPVPAAKPQKLEKRKCVRYDPEAVRREEILREKCKPVPYEAMERDFQEWVGELLEWTEEGITQDTERQDVEMFATLQFLRGAPAKGVCTPFYVKEAYHFFMQGMVKQCLAHSAPEREAILQRCWEVAYDTYSLALGRFLLRDEKLLPYVEQFPRKYLKQLRGLAQKHAAQQDKQWEEEQRRQEAVALELAARDLPIF